jgi:hypothetical protein
LITEPPSRADALSCHFQVQSSLPGQAVTISRATTAIFNAIAIRVWLENKTTVASVAYYRDAP